MAIRELSPRSEVTREKMPEEELGTLLSAIGNHEGKALLLASMSTGTIYSSKDLQRLMLDRQNGHLVWKLSAVLPLLYCRRSLSSAELVRPGLVWHDGSVYGFEITNRGQEEGSSLAGHLLEFSERHPDVSLAQLFGNLKSTAITNHRIFKELLARNSPIRITDLAVSLKGDTASISHRIVRLSQFGVIEYDSSKADVPYSYFKLAEGKPKTIPQTYATSKKLTADIYEFLSNLSGPEISLESVYQELLRRNPERKPSKFKIAGILNHLEKQGFLERKKFGRLCHSEIKLTDNQRAMHTEVVDILEKFSSGDSEYREYGKRKAFHIVNNSRRFASLLLKAKENSSVANREEDRGLVEKQIITTLYLHPGSTNTKIRDYLNKDYDRTLSDKRISQLTKKLREEGRVAIAAKGNAFHYQVAAN